MEPPSKRLRLDYPGAADDDEDDQDEISMDPAQFDATQDPMYQLDKGRAKAVTRLKSAFEDIFEKYSQDFDGDDDVINFYTDEIEVDNGHVESLKEKKKDGATYSSDSSDEEERISSGKPGGRGDKSPLKSKSKPKPKSKSKSLMLANRAKPIQTPRLQSQWNPFPGLGAHQLPSLAFAPSPYVAPPLPPFQLAQSPYASGLVDPVWQAPDLPPQLPHHQSRSLTGSWGSRFGSFGGQSGPAVKRLVTAKSFLQHAASTSSETNDDDIEEGDMSPNKPGSVGKELVQARTTKPSTSDVVSTQHHKPAKSPQTRSPGVPKRKQSKKSETCKSAIALDDQLERGARSLRPNERRIEIIIPMMKRLPTELRPTMDEKEPMGSGGLTELESEPGLPANKNPITTHLRSDQCTSQSTDRHRDEASDPESADLADSSRGTHVKHMAHVDEDRDHTSTPSQLPGTRRLRSTQKPPPTEAPSKNASPHEEQCLEHACTEATGERDSPQIATENVATDAVCVSLHEQKSSCDNESDGVVPSPPLSPTVNTDADETQATHITNMEENLGDSERETLVNDQGPKELSVQPLLTEALSKHNVDDVVGMSDPAIAEVDVPETAISQELGATPYENEGPPQDEPDSPLANTVGEGILSISSHAPDKTTARHPDLHPDDVFSSPQIPNTRNKFPTIIGSQRAEYSAIRETTELEFDTDQDTLPPVVKASHTYEDKEQDSSHRSFLSSELVAEIGGLQLNSDHRDSQHSPSPGAQELPDEDLSIFPPGRDAHSTSELVFRSPTSTKQPETHHDVDMGRSPSPELGTPSRPEIIQRTASSQTKTKKTPAPTTPTKSRGCKGAKPRSGHHHTPSSRRSTLSSLIPEDIDDESDDELSMVGSFSRFHSPFSRTNANESPVLPPLFSLPKTTPRRKRDRNSGLLISPSSSPSRTPSRILGPGRDGNKSPATDSRQAQVRRGRGRPRAAATTHSSPLARTVAERLLSSSPTKRYHRAAAPAPGPGLVLSPRGTLRRCGEAGFACERPFCLTCCK
ncbi:hypothetical protein F5Y14DRAFT_29017 [Nemania sp. NC0429]|nr:hypothetical protein F5Y14DRAFT_29017 [Nemania sp. NC0429]